MNPDRVTLLLCPLPSPLSPPTDPRGRQVGDEDARNSQFPESQLRRDDRDDDESSLSSSGRSGDDDESDAKEAGDTFVGDIAGGATTKVPDRRSPTASVSKLWEGYRSFPRPGTSFLSKSATFFKNRKSLVERWADPVSAPSFSAPRKDDCLAGIFEKVASSDKRLHDFAFDAMKYSGGAAHATIAASEHLGSALPKVVESIIGTLLPPGSEGHDDWMAWAKEEVGRVHKESAAIMMDAVSLNATIYGKGFWHMREAVLKKCDKAVLPTLRNRAPESSTFFGNPCDAVQSSVSLAFMTDHLSRPASRGFSTSKRGAAVASRAPRSSNRSATSVAASSSTAGNDRDRRPRGGQAGRGNKKR